MVLIRMRREPTPVTTGPTPSALVLTEGAGHDRSALAAVRALAADGYRPVVGTTADRSLAAASRYAGATVPLPPATSPSLAATIEALSGEYAAVFPASDDLLLALRPELHRWIDKASLAEAAGAVGLATPPTRSFPSAQHLVEAAPDLDFPLVVKPALKEFGLPVYIAETAADVAVSVHQGPVVVQPVVDGLTEAIAGVIWDGRTVMAVQQHYLRVWPPRCGTAAYARVVAVDELRLHRLEAMLSGYQGIFQAQFVGGALIDVNLRVYGSMPLAVAAGANLPAAVCRLSAGEPVQAANVRLGTTYRWMEGDLRNLWHATRKGRPAWTEVAGALRPVRHTAHSVVRITDPGPFLVRLREVAGRVGGDRP